MKDRISLYPGRVELTPVPGQTNVYDMTRADEPQEAGTPLNKATLLKDDVAMLLGLDPKNATPNDVFEILLNEITTIRNTSAKVVTGSYTGNGKAKTLTFDSQPQLVIVRSNRNANYGDCGWLMLMRGCQTTTFSYATSSGQVVTATWSGNSVTWAHTEATPGGTYSGTPYVYVAIIK